MKVDELAQSLNQVGNLNNSASRNVDADTKAAQTVERDTQLDSKIDISTESSDYSYAAKIVGQIDEARVQHVEELKDMVQSGEYNVDSVKVAGRVVEDNISDVTQGS